MNDEFVAFRALLAQHNAVLSVKTAVFGEYLRLCELAGVPPRTERARASFNAMDHRTGAEVVHEHLSDCSKLCAARDRLAAEWLPASDRTAPQHVLAAGKAAVTCDCGSSSFVRFDMVHAASAIDFVSTHLARSLSASTARTGSTAFSCRVVGWQRMCA